ncbi:MAG: CDP-alcohol phosphatidyltransferase family protein [Thermoleophilaceae bacterium]
MSAPREPSDGTRARPRRSSAVPGSEDGARPRRGGSAGRTDREARSSEMRAVARQRLIDSRLTPNTISLTGFALNLGAAGLIVAELFVLGAIAFAVGSAMDALDGRYSRMSGKGTHFGAFLDSTLDRVEEGVVLAAVGAVFAANGDAVAVAATIIAVLGSLMVSYTRARAEALGLECKVGLAQRPPRVVILGIGIFFAAGAGLGDFSLLAPAIYALAVLTSVTALQRVLHVRTKLREAGGV